jgi:Flp pilus assembly pilin Flp
MNQLKRKNAAPLNESRGASLVEYALLLALIAVVCIVALIFLGEQARKKLEEQGAGSGQGNEGEVIDLLTPVVPAGNSGGDGATPPPTQAPQAQPPIPPIAQPPPDDGGSDLCAANGGIQWQGTQCTCSGYVDAITICGDDTKLDSVSTTETCTPNANECGSQSGDGGTSTGGGCACEYRDPCSPGMTSCPGWYDCNGSTCRP